MQVKDTERSLIARYALPILKRQDLPLRTIRTVLGWLEERSSYLGLKFPKGLRKAVGNYYSTKKFNVASMEANWNEHREKVIASLEKVAAESPPPQPLTRNVKMLVKSLALPPQVSRLVILAACYSRFEQVEYFCDAVAEVITPLPRMAAIMTGENPRAFDRLLSPLGEVISSGLLQLNEENDNFAGSYGRYSLPWRIDLSLDQNYRNFSDMRRILLGRPLTARLEAGDYDHAANDRDLIINVIRGAVKEGARGVNILLYGPPGSGKTELTKMAAQEVGISLYATGEDNAATRGNDDKDGNDETNRRKRLADLVFALRLLETAKGTAILFDEMEDIALQLIKRGGSKLYLNRILENNPVPVLWTSNHINEIDPAVLRRMTLAIELRQPPASQRVNILRRLDQRIGVGLSEDDLEYLSVQIEATPAVMENALRAAKFSGGGRDAVERAARGVIRAIYGARARRSPDVSEFDPRIACTTPDLLSLSSRLESNGSLDFSLLLYGPPGTGKSAYARYLAKRLGIEVIHKRASDILNAYVGESEKKIAEAFEQSREQKAMLIFDEAETFLFDRRDAVRSWEVTQVNEMLTWMENHPYPVICTTNIRERVDQASMRRFTFHVQYDYLGKAELSYAYELFFGFRSVPGEGLAFTNLTPGDFAQARRQARVMGVMDKPREVISLLHKISTAKPGSRSAIGFVN